MGYLYSFLLYVLGTLSFSTACFIESFGLEWWPFPSFVEFILIVPILCLAFLCLLPFNQALFAYNCSSDVIGLPVACFSQLTLYSSIVPVHTTGSLKDDFLADLGLVDVIC